MTSFFLIAINEAQFIGQLTYISTYLTINLIKKIKSFLSKFFGKQLLKEIEILCGQERFGLR